MTFTTFFDKLSFQTKKRLQFITITKQIQDIVKKSGIQSGSIIIQSMHTTARLWVNEDEKNLIGNGSMSYTPDIHQVLDTFADPDATYYHNDIKDVRNPEGKRDTHLCAPDDQGVCYECKNGHAHAQALMLPHALTFIVQDCKLVKGYWQEIMLIELDHDRKREVSILVQGEK
ncbi:YjbQ family protein [Candidatus Woesearchaeota archaeon]|nr:YjbQ family protein [Candidatus Woesearchaeota archaeon]